MGGRGRTKQYATAFEMGSSTWLWRSRLGDYLCYFAVPLSAPFWLRHQFSISRVETVLKCDTSSLQASHKHRNVRFDFIAPVTMSIDLKFDPQELEDLVKDMPALCGHSDFSLFLGSVLNNDESGLSRSLLFTKQCNICSAHTIMTETSEKFSLDVALPRGKVWPVTDATKLIQD
jgi:hypothetical protein